MAEAACREAADIILRARPGVLEFNRVKEKDGGEGPVTEADLKVCRGQRGVRSWRCWTASHPPNPLFLPLAVHVRRDAVVLADEECIRERFCE